MHSRRDREVVAFCGPASRLLADSRTELGVLEDSQGGAGDGCWVQRRDHEAGQAVLAAAIPALAAVSEWTHSAIEAALQAALIDGLGLKPRHAYGPLRVAATGRTVSPPLFESLEILGRERSLARLTAARA